MERLGCAGPRGWLLKLKMHRALGVLGAWLVALWKETPIHHDCSCNCTCSVDTSVGECVGSLSWELVKGLIHCAFGILISLLWPVLRKFIPLIIQIVSRVFAESRARTCDDPGEIGDPEKDSALESRAREQLAAVRHRQALRAPDGSRRSN